jgi:predicted component of type VI protein secretion system
MMHPVKTKQIATFGLGLLLAVALFASPFRLHHATGRLPFATHTHYENTAQHSSSQHSQHADQDQRDDLRCLRCVLQTFEVAEILQPLVVIFAVLGRLEAAKPLEPTNIFILDTTARSPPTF